MEVWNIRGRASDVNQVKNKFKITTFHFAIRMWFVINALVLLAQTFQLISCY